jgi:predicted alpha/beta hydrolase family esterase
MGRGDETAWAADDRERRRQKQAVLRPRIACAKRLGVVVLVLVVLAMVAVPVALNAFAYAMSRTARGAGGAPQSASPAAFVRALFHESLAAVCCLATWPLAPVLAGRASARSPHHGTVVLVAGCAPDRASLWLVARRLRRRGWLPSHVAPHRWPREGEAARAAIDACVRRARAAAPDKPVVLVAHAAGGLAARDYLRRHPESPVSMLLTLGTPHGETSPAPVRFACLHGPTGAAVRELADNDPVPDQFNVVAISSDFDAWVVPPAAAYYPRAFNISVSTVGHFGLLVSRRVFALILENIEAAALSQAARPASTASNTRATSSSSL